MAGSIYQYNIVAFCNAAFKASGKPQLLSFTGNICFGKRPKPMTRTAHLTTMQNLISVVRHLNHLSQETVTGIPGMVLCATIVS